MQREQKRLELADRLKSDKADTAVDNAKFNEEIIASHAEETQRTNTELQEVFNTARKSGNILLVYYAKRMLPLFRAVVKFYNINRLFKKLLT